MSDGSVEPRNVLDLLENPPPGVYRMKGRINVGGRGYIVNVVGSSIDLVAFRGKPGPSHLVAIGMHLDTDSVRAQVEKAIDSVTTPSADGVRALRRYVCTGS